MLKQLILRVLPMLLLGSLALSSCVVHEHDRGPRGYGRSHPHDHGRGPGRGDGYGHR